MQTLSSFPTWAEGETSKGEEDKGSHCVKSKRLDVVLKEGLEPKQKKKKKDDVVKGGCGVVHAAR